MTKRKVRRAVSPALRFRRRWVDDFKHFGLVIVLRTHAVVLGTKTATNGSAIDNKTTTALDACVSTNTCHNAHEDSLVYPDSISL